MDGVLARSGTRRCRFGLVILALLGSIECRAAEPGWKQLTHDGWLKHHPRWSPDGKELAYSEYHEDNIRIMILKPETGKPPEKLTKQSNPDFEPSWSPDGKQILFSFDKAMPNQGDIEVARVNRDGSDLQVLVSSPGALSHEESPCWSPDGKQMVFVSTREGNQEIYTANSDGSNLKRLTTDSAMDRNPVWSPDGKRIYFSTNRWGNLEIAWMPPDGSKVTRLTNNRSLDDSPAISADGKRLAYTSHRDGNYEVYVMDVATGQDRNETQSAEMEISPGWHPDGRLTFVSNRDGDFDLYIK